MLTPKQWREAIHCDIQLLAVLHDKEPNAALLAELKQTRFPYQLNLQLSDNASQESLSFMADSLKEFPVEMDAAQLDELAADFAAIYLNHSIQASPCESVWLDEEGLMRQQPMFAVRGWYEKYGLQVDDWRLRPDDHLVCQLQFIAHLLKQEEVSHLAQVAQFLDEHLLLWIKDFAARVSQRAGTAYYAGLALLTAAYLDQLRQVLEALELPQPTTASAEPA